MGSEVIRTRTPLSTRQIVDGLSGAYLELEGQDIPERLLESLTVLVLIETDHGRALDNNNSGNVSANPSTYGGYYFRPRWYALTEASTDRDRELHQLMLDKKAPEAFRAYMTAQDGFKDYLRHFLADKRRPLLEAFEAGNAAAMVAELQRFYSPDYNSDHVDTINRLQAELRAEGYFAPPSSRGTPGPTSGHDVGRALLAIVAIGSAGAYLFNTARGATPARKPKPS